VTSFPDIAGAGKRVRKLIAFDDDTFDKLKQLGRDRMATIQELADEAFTDVLKKHGIPIDLKDALRKSVSQSKTPANKNAKSRHQGNADHDDRSGSVRRRPARRAKEHSG
jgi:non-homologous end joining protein Ku